MKKTCAYIFLSKERSLDPEREDLHNISKAVSVIDSTSPVYLELQEKKRLFLF